MAITITPQLQKLINHLKSEVSQVLDISLQEVPAEWLKDVDCSEPVIFNCTVKVSPGHPTPPNVSFGLPKSVYENEKDYSQIVGNLKQLINSQPNAVNYEEVRESANT
jgi:hypothetical protein